MNNINQTIRQNLRFLDNQYVSAAISLFLVLYAGLAAPELPESVAKLFENTLFKLLVFFLIAYTSRKDPTVAIIAAVGLMISLQTLNRYNVEKKMVDVVRASEENASHGAAVEEFAAEQNRMSGEMQEALPPQIQMAPSQGGPSGQIPQCQLKELEQEVAPIDSESVDFHDQFYPQYVDYDNQHLSRQYSQQLTGVGCDTNSDSSSYSPI